MKTKLVKVGNSRGIRIPRDLLKLYAIEEGDALELEETREGILIRPSEERPRKLSWSDSYREMVGEAADQAEWAAWDSVSRDGLDD
ncbi:MAG: AbrB/MazE/SpoVT family DNA-binding domain-containing protein [Spirochaetia bacterium]